MGSLGIESNLNKHKNGSLISEVDTGPNVCKTLLISGSSHQDQVSAQTKLAIWQEAMTYQTTLTVRSDQGIIDITY